MTNRVPGMLVVLAVLISGCNMPTQSAGEAPVGVETASAGQLPTLEPSPVPPTETSTPEPAATSTATETETPAPVPPQVKANTEESACYFGPGTEYSIEGALTDAVFVPVLGKDQYSEWVQIAHPVRERVYCWLPLDKVYLEGDLEMAPYVPSPTPFVAYVSVEMNPDSRTVSCGTFTFDVKFTISVTGPTTVKFRRSRSGDAAGSLESYEFAAAGSHTFTDSMMRGSSGTHTFRVEVTSPNGISGEDSSSLKCE